MFVKSADGKPTQTFWASKTDSACDIKIKIRRRLGMPTGKMMLNFGGEFLKDEQCLGIYDVQKESALHLSHKL
jgi:hypothetical protein